MKGLLFMCVAVSMLVGCASAPSVEKGPTITLPVFTAWYNGNKVYYIATEISDPAMAAMMGATYAPRLADAVPEYPKPPEQKTVIERVYKFPNNEQDGVFASIPNPLGPKSVDPSYSPVWLVYEVRWMPAASPRILNSEEAILAADDAGYVNVKRTSIVINCPIVATEQGAVLPNSVLVR